MSSRLEIGLALLLAVAITVAVWAGNRAPKPPAEDQRTSTFLTGPDGSRGVYEVLVRLGRPVQRQRSSLVEINTDTARRPALLVVLNPVVPLQPEEIEQVVAYVRAGGAVLSAGRGGGILRCTGWRLEPDRWTDDSVNVSTPAGMRPLPRVARVLQLQPKDSTEAPRRSLEGLVKQQPDSVNSCSQLVAERREPFLYAATGRPVLLRLWYPGGGSITLASDEGWFTNRIWRDTDVPLVALPLLASPRGARGRIVVDEYHQGFHRDEHSATSLTWVWLQNSPVGWAVLQILAIGLVWLAVMAVRFGPAREVVERRRRSPLEHLDALGAGLESARDEGTAVRRLVAGLQRRLSVSRGGSGNMETWLEALELAMRRPEGRAAVRRLRDLLRERSGTDGNLVLATAQAVEDVWEELRPRTTREQY
ncbi:MAG TPA: DUF4350 domain-containing protein [Gemmatimonadales bacterium]|nr:DUF4350 domain-containing protein [Gemmatimonadales bacterium]